MIITQTPLADCFILEPKVFDDGRGSFFESFNQLKFEEETGRSLQFVQDNQSISHRGVLRGLHFQKGDFAQAKLVRVIRGKVLDVVVDIRHESHTFGKSFSLLLTGDNNKQLFIPRGFAHGFSVLEDNTIFAYKCDNYYHKASEGGIRFDDSSLAIDWMLEPHEIEVSEKDSVLPSFSELSF